MNASPLTIPEQPANDMRLAGNKAWMRGLFSGFNGNMSIRMLLAGEQHALVTATGAVKSELTLRDFSLVRLADGQCVAGGTPSSEFAMHRAIYATQSGAVAIMHTHPPKLLTLFALLPPEKRLLMPIHEATPLRARLAFAPEFPPGTKDLARAVAKLAATHEAVWMEKHGLMVWGATLAAAGALSEELEHLAGIQLALHVHTKQ